MAIVTIDDVPVHLMPVALALAYLTVMMWGRVALSRVGPGPSQSRTTANPRTSTPAAMIVRPGILGLLGLAGYCYVVGRIQGGFQKAAHASFDPYVVLNLGTAKEPMANLTKAVVTDKYKEMVKRYHPSNPETGNADLLRDAMDAFQALTDESARRQWKASGHPRGPLLTPVFQFAIPRWLVVGRRQPLPRRQRRQQESLLPSEEEKEEERIRPSMVAVHVVMIAYLLRSFLRMWRGDETALSSSSSSIAADDLNWNLESNTVHDLDLQYLADHVDPDMTVVELLLLAVSAPTNLVWGQRDVEKIEAMREERLEKLRKPQKFSYDDLLQEEGLWATDEDDDDQHHGDDDEGSKEARFTAKQERKRAEKEAEEKRRAAEGAKMEGVDDGVLGQLWVERTLEAAGEWPPATLGCLSGKTFEWSHGGKKKQMLSAMDHPAMRRLLCFFTGRLNAQMLNSHPELVQAGISKLIDATYFQSSLVFRHRMNLLLDAILKIGIVVQSRRLVRTGVEASALFKVGTKPGSEAGFREMMMKQYGVTPQLSLTTLEVATDGEKEIATGESTQMTFEVERLHAESFFRHKLQQLQQQGIPPQVGLQAYREGWWFLVSCERLEGKGKATPLNRDDESIKAMNISDKQLTRFNKEKLEDRLLATLPMMLGNISQRSFKASGSIKAPAVAGKYRFTLEIKSIEFLGADVSRSVEVQVVDAATLARKPKQEPAEPKKDK
jgi:hypothetical protein